MTIRTLFDPSREIDRRIEKVIQYDNMDPTFLKNEISEYVVTESMTRSFEKLLDAIDTGMGDGSNEVGVWVSGFYGSGKSSFTKYLGFALDDSCAIDNKPFLQYLQDRLTDAPLRQRLATVAARHNPAVIMLDLASTQLADASKKAISNVLYARVMQWAGYSRDRKVAYLEFMLEREGKLTEFRERIEQLSGGVTWDQLKNQPLVTNQLASQLASEFYPAVYKDSKSFHDQKLDEAIMTDDQAREMIDLVRRRTGRENIVFILDEVGEYVSSQDGLILNLDGLAKNLKQIGGGKVWVFATAQQTLTEDDPRAQFNTTKLFKLKDRFPIRVDLEANDIREICYRRLLGKSSAGEEQLRKLFDQNGQQLRFNTRLHNTRLYEKDLDKETFMQLYPFLPQHFEILLELLARLAKSLGGVGLRSAIKVIQDVLISDDTGTSPLADRPVGTLATTVTFYDALRLDIRRSSRHVVEGVDKALRNFGADSMQARVAKSVAILQSLGDFPVSRENVAALLHDAVDAPSQQKEVEQAVTGLLIEETVPLSEIDGHLRFMSEAVSELENERRGLIPMQNERSRIINGVLNDMFTPLPRASLHGTRTIQCGIKSTGPVGPVSISGDREEIQMHLDFVPESDFDATKQALIAESTQPAAQSTIFLTGLEPAGFQQHVEEIYRSDQIFNDYRNKTVEKEVTEYLNGQQQRAQGLRVDLTSKSRKGLEQGTFVFRGRPQAVANLGGTLDDAAKKQIGEAADEIFHKYSEAPLQAESALTERFLKTERLDVIERRNDPLTLVGTNGLVNKNHVALKSVTDYLRQSGREEGRTLLDKFSRAPYGWSKDTLRYLIGALLVGGEIKLRVSGEDITVRGPGAIESLKSNAAFNRVGVALRDGGIEPDSLLRASDRLVELTGEQALPMEDQVSKVVTRYFPDLQNDYAHIAVELRNLNLPGAERADRVREGLSEILKGDASDAAARLGQEECPLYEDLLWARQVAKALAGDMPDAVGKANRILADIPVLPDIGPLAKLRTETADDLEKLKDAMEREDFFAHLADIQTALRHVEQAVSVAAHALAAEYDSDLEAEKCRLEETPEWRMVGGDDQERLAASLDALKITVTEDMNGIHQCLNARYPMQQRLAAIAEELRKLAEVREQTAGEQEGEDETTTFIADDFMFPAEVNSAEELDTLIQRLQSLKERFANYTRIVFGKNKS